MCCSLQESASNQWISHFALCVRLKESGTNGRSYEREEPKREATPRPAWSFTRRFPFVSLSTCWLETRVWKENGRLAQVDASRLPRCEAVVWVKSPGSSVKDPFASTERVSSALPHGVETLVTITTCYWGQRIMHVLLCALNLHAHFNLLLLLFSFFVFFVFYSYLLLHGDDDDDCLWCYGFFNFFLYS